MKTIESARFYIYIYTLRNILELTFLIHWIPQFCKHFFAPLFRRMAGCRPGESANWSVISVNLIEELKYIMAYKDVWFLPLNRYPSKSHLQNRQKSLYKENAPNGKSVFFKLTISLNA